MASMLDRGDSYQVQYLGSSMLAVRAVTGLGVLQKPLMQMYFRYQKDKSRNAARLEQRRVVMSDKGMIVSSEGDPDSPCVQEDYGMPSILFWEAVRFVTVKTRDKKIRAAFEPLDMDRSPTKENLFVTLDKSLHFVHKREHLPLFCCVLRRTRGLKALDVHAFVCYSDEEALGLVRALDAVNVSYTSEERQETGVFGYNPFGKESIRSAAGLQLATRGGQSPATKGKGLEVGRHQSARCRPSEGAVEKSSAGRPSNNRLVSVRNKTDRAKSPRRRPASSDFGLFTGSQPNLSVFSNCPTADPEARAPAAEDKRSDRNSRVFLLSQADFSSQLCLAETADSAAEGDVGGYADHIDRSLDGGRGKGRTYRVPGDASKFVGVSMRSDKSSDDAQRSDQNADSVRQQPSFDGRGIFQEEEHYSAHDLRKDDQPSSGRKMGQGYSLLSRSTGPPPGYAPHQSSRQPYAPSPTGEERQTSNFGQHVSASNIENNITDGYQRARQFGGVREPSDSPSQNDRDTSAAPRIPQRTPVLPATRDITTSPEKRQAVHGVVMAQLTPYSERGSSPFTSRRAPPGVQASVRDHEPLGPYAANQTPTPTHSKPVAKVPPHKVQGVKVLPSQPSLRKRDGSAPTDEFERKPKDSYAMMSSGDVNKEDVCVHRLRQSSVFDDRCHHRNVPSPSRYCEEQNRFSGLEASSTNDIYSVVDKSKKGSEQAKTKNASKSQQSVDNWQFHKTPAKQSFLGKGNQLFSSDRRNFDDFYSESLIQSEKKDAEIASLLQNIRFDYEGTSNPHAPHGTNFEKSLGYFP